MPDTTPGKLNDFQNLMLKRVQEILVVASAYEWFLLSQDGQLQQQMIGELAELNPANLPRLTHVTDTHEALAMIESGRRFDLVISTPRAGDVANREFAGLMRKRGVNAPIVLLAFDDRGQREIEALRGTGDFESMFLWQGDFRLLLAIAHSVEDRWNLEHDTAAGGVQLILLIEDSVRFYSAYLPLLYSEVIRQSQAVLTEGVNFHHRLMRKRARPKIVHCASYEEAWRFYTSYKASVLGIITDVEFPWHDVVTEDAGTAFARRVRGEDPELPILLQSSNPRIADVSGELHVHIALKHSPTLLSELRSFMLENFGFGDFVFRLPSGEVVDRVSDLPALEWRLYTIRDESLLYHAGRDDFSRWLKARTEFELAARLKSRKVSDYATTENLRNDLISTLREFRIARESGQIVDFVSGRFDGSDSLTRLGGGSLGGKARSLAFIRSLLAQDDLSSDFPGVRMHVPSCVVLGTEVFEQFLEQNRLNSAALLDAEDAEIERRFTQAALPEHIRSDLTEILSVLRYPLAVRSSGLLADSQLHPFTGVYATFMLPNNQRRARLRVQEVETAIKRVYASMFMRKARAHLAAADYRIEEERMAVMIQRLVGQRHEQRFYPNVSGVARSHSFYPLSPMTAADGEATIALGLGQTIVEGHPAFRFCPKFPTRTWQLATTHDNLKETQKYFFALNLDVPDDAPVDQHESVAKHDLDMAWTDGTLAAVGSTYFPEEDTIRDGFTRSGVPLVTFAPILKHETFPLAGIIQRVLTMCADALNCPVEIEFAANLGVTDGTPSEFAILQVRPFVLNREFGGIPVVDHGRDELLCSLSRALGSGRVEELHDLVVVDPDCFERSRSSDVADEIGRMNTTLARENIPYLLIGPGRWGSSDPWLGIPVRWEQISGARVIVESGLKDIDVLPSQGAHFFRQLTSHQVGYFTVNPDPDNGGLDWEWLRRTPSMEATAFVRHLRLSAPAVVHIDGRTNQGIILKPQA